MDHPVDRVFASLIGLPPWCVRRRGRWQLLMEFGTPHHVVEEVAELLVSVPGLPESAPRRSSSIEGEWHLWIDTRHWNLSWREVSIARSESDMAVIDKALAFHEGQALRRVRVDPTNGATRFEFDLDCVLETAPRPEPARYGGIQWYLFHRTSGWVFVVDENGRYRHAPSDTDPEDECWLALPS